MKWFLSVAIMFFILTGCVSTVGVKSSPRQNQEVIYSRGSEVIASQNQNFVAISIVEPEYKETKRSRYLVFFKNLSQSPVNFSTQNITAAINGVGVRVCTYAQLAKEIERNRDLQQFSNSLAGAFNSIGAVNSGYTNYNGTVYNQSMGVSSYSGSSYNTGDAYATQALVQAETKQNSGRINNQANSSLYTLEKLALRKQTVWPNKYHGGFIQLEKHRLSKPKNSLTINVDVAGERHSFNFILTEKRR